MSKAKKRPPEDKEPPLPVEERSLDEIVGALLRVPIKKRPKSSKKNSRSKIS